MSVAHGERCALALHMRRLRLMHTDAARAAERWREAQRWRTAQQWACCLRCASASHVLSAAVQGLTHVSHESHTILTHVSHTSHTGLTQVSHLFADHHLLAHHAELLLGLRHVLLHLREALLVVRVKLQLHEPRHPAE